MEQQLREIMAMQGLKPRSIYIYVRAIQRLQDWCIRRHTDLDHVTADELSAYTETLAEGRSTRMQLRSALKYYYEATGRAPNPYRAIAVPPKRRMVCRAFEQDDAALLYKTAREWQSGPQGVVTLSGLLMALRRFEIGHLEWRDFDSRGEWLTVRGKFGVVADIPVHPVVAERLDWWRMQDPPSGHTRPGERYVFEGRRGNHVHPATVWDWIRQVGEAAGIGLIKPHHLRHTALAEANERTGDLRAVQDLARHRDPETTAGYTRVSRDRLRRALLSIDYETQHDD